MVARRRLDVAEQFEDLFHQLTDLRGRIAANAGFDQYVSYAFRAKRRFDYDAEDCLKFHQAVETYFVD